MIFFDGEIYENDMCDKLLARFEDRICDTLGNCRLSAKQVMLAAEKISTDIENGAFDDMLSALDVENVSYYKQLKPNLEIQTALSVLRTASLRK